MWDNASHLVFFTSDQLFIFTQQNGLCTFDAYGDSDELYSIIPLSGYENDVLLGIIRMVGDGFTIVWIQDILVLPSR